MLERLAPPLLSATAHNLRTYKRLRAPASFSNISARPEDLPEIADDAFASEAWLKHQSNPSKTEPDRPFSHHAAVKLLAAQMGAGDVLDFGGGPGVLVPTIHAANPDAVVRVVESPAICEIGRKSFPGVEFHGEAGSALAATRPGGLSICIGTLHYCMNWRDIVAMLARSAPGHIVIGRHYFSDTAPTMYGVQDIYVPAGHAGKSAVVFVSPADLAAEMKRHGYGLLCQVPLFPADWDVARSERHKLPSFRCGGFVYRREPAAQ